MLIFVFERTISVTDEMDEFEVIVQTTSGILEEPWWCKIMQQISSHIDTWTTQVSCTPRPSSSYNIIFYFFFYYLFIIIIVEFIHLFFIIL